MEDRNVYRELPKPRSASISFTHTSVKSVPLRHAFVSVLGGGGGGEEEDSVGGEGTGSAESRFQDAEDRKQ